MSGRTTLGPFGGYVRKVTSGRLDRGTGQIKATLVPIVPEGSSFTKIHWPGGFRTSQPNCTPPRTTSLLPISYFIAAPKCFGGVAQKTQRTNGKLLWCAALREEADAHFALGDDALMKTPLADGSPL
jgi:hypothetical protein